MRVVKTVQYNANLSIIPACVEIIKEYNQAMTKLFSEHRDIVEEILNE